MAPSYRRMDRVDELLKAEISRVIREDVADPRVGFVTVMDVETSPDLRNARVFVSVLGGEEREEEAIEALRRASGYMRSLVGEVVRLKYLPELRFEVDRTVKRAARIESLIEEVREEREEGEEETEPDDGGGDDPA